MKATELKTPASDIWQRFELQEAAYWSDYYRNASSETIERCGIHVSTIGSAQISIAANIDILGFNRVIGLGID
ncbi:MAG: hypothetical protein GWN00_09285, partial [Aliifodinibius sp.]|nr:hypothetical protein [Fodinibius sp.]NIV11358.1 hypothetical protein [Fodinibius sp.]NIY24988.1 hypothetical protein [Fodinibius sp.]